VRFQLNGRVWPKIKLINAVALGGAVFQQPKALALLANNGRIIAVCDLRVQVLCAINGDPYKFLQVGTGVSANIAGVARALALGQARVRTARGSVLPVFGR